MPVIIQPMRGVNKTVTAPIIIKDALHPFEVMKDLRPKEKPKQLYFCCGAVTGILFGNSVVASDCRIIRESVKYYETSTKQNPSDVCSFYNLANEYVLKNKLVGWHCYANKNIIVSVATQTY